MRSQLARPRALQLATAVSLLGVAAFAACSEGAPNGPLAGSSAATRAVDVAAATERAALPVNVDAPYYDFQVERQARQIPGSGNLRYPTDMRLANREGEVLTRFVVDERGLVDMKTFRAMKSSDPAFTAAVVRALPGMRFVPAEVGGHAVRQLVEQPFTFDLSRN